MDNTLFKSTTSDDENLRILYSASTHEPESLSDTEDNETIYFVTNDTNQTEHFLVVSDQSIKEKNTLTGRTTNKWTLTMLESCEHISVDVVRIRFDTVKRDKRERVYKMEKDQGRTLDNFLRNLLSQRLSDIMNIYGCANCNLQFSHEKVPRNRGKTMSLSN